MGQNLRINPQTKDYELVNGSPVASNRIHEDVYYALMISSGQWIHGEPNQGSELYRLQGIKRTPNIERMFSAFAEQAVRSQVINSGRARQIQTYYLQSARTGSSNQINVEPQNKNVSNTITFRPV